MYARKVPFLPQPPVDLYRSLGNGEERASSSPLTDKFETLVSVKDKVTQCPILSLVCTVFCKGVFAVKSQGLVWSYPLPGPPSVLCYKGWADRDAIWDVDLWSQRNREGALFKVTFKGSFLGMPDFSFIFRWLCSLTWRTSALLHTCLIAKIRC